MRIKHTYLFTMFVGLVWAGLLFGYQNGPGATGAGAVNGVFGSVATCNQAGCHSSFPLNSGGGTLTLTGLPAQWTPGTTYPLTITVQKSGAQVYGFQISAVYDSVNPPQSAGTLSKGKTSGTDFTRISVVTADGLQLVEHNSINASLAATTTYFVNWTAPSDTSRGAVRFNLAGNAANRDQQPTGDFIYTLVNVVPPGAAAPPPDFILAPSAATATVNAGSSTTLTVGVTPANGFSSAVALSVTGLPAEATGTFDSGSIQIGATATLTISTTSAAVPGTYPLTITGTSGSLSHSANVSLTIAPPPGNPSRDFALVNFGSNSSATDGSGSLTLGYATIQPAAASTTPAGVEIFSFRNNNILVSETGVPASPLLTSGRIYAETNLPVNTGLAIANPNAQAANITFFFTRTDGTSTAPRMMTIEANRQEAHFLNEDPFRDPALGDNVQGTFSFTSTVPVSVVALRGFTNERNDFLISTLPVIDTTTLAATGTQVLPHFATGNGWTTQVLLINPGSSALSGNLQFVGVTGTAATVTVGGQATSTAPYTISAGSSQKIVASGPVAGGSIRVVPSNGGVAPVPLVVFSYKPGSFTLTEAGSPANAGLAFRMYVESSGAAGQSGNIQSGIAVANTTNSPATVTFELFKTDGTSAGLVPATASLPASGQVAKFLAEIFQGQNLPQPFQGVLRISSAANISVVGLRGRYNERVTPSGPDFLITTTPPSLESSPASAGQLLFPHLVNGGGYTTQFILFSGTAGQISNGTLRFFTQLGAPLNLSLNN